MAALSCSVRLCIAIVPPCLNLAKSALSNSRPGFYRDDFTLQSRSCTPCRTQLVGDWVPPPNEVVIARRSLSAYGTSTKAFRTAKNFFWNFCETNALDARLENT